MKYLGEEKMTELLYLDNSYEKEFEAQVVSVKDDKFIVLDKSLFYGESGGQPHDEGKLVNDSGEEFNIVFAKKFGNDISLEIDKPGLKIGDKVKGILNWDRRYKLMRMHTACHVLCGFLFKDYGAKITGNQIGIDKSRVDFNIEKYDPELLKQAIVKSNEYISGEHDVKIYYMDREECVNDPNMMKLASVLPPAIKQLRIVDLPDLDKQPDGGTQVKNVKEIGVIEFLKSSNKGKGNRRIYFVLKD